LLPFHCHLSCFKKTKIDSFRPIFNFFEIIDKFHEILSLVKFFFISLIREKKNTIPFSHNSSIFKRKKPPSFSLGSLWFEKIISLVG